MSLTQPSLETSTQGTLGHATLLSLLGFRDLQPLIAQASHEEQTFEQSLQDAYEDYLTSQDQSSIQTLHQALTTTIEQLERERATDHTRGWREKSSVQTRWCLEVVFGSNRTNAWGNGILNLSSLMDGQRGFVLHGAGASVSTAGDVNGDRLTDFIVGDVVSDSGNVYVFFGNRSSVWGNGTLNISSLMNGQRGFALHGDSGQFIGRTVSAGDINGDGFDDVLVGSFVDYIFVVFGSNSSTAWSAGHFNLSTLLDGQRGFGCAGEGAYASGSPVSALEISMVTD